MRRALVTGGSGVLGRSICRALGGMDLHVVVHANRGATAAESLAGEIRAAGGSSESVLFDVTDPQQCRSKLEKLLEDGPIQVVVNNAGIHDDAPLLGMQPEQWRRVLAVSLDGFFNVTQPLLMAMIGTRWGRIVNVSSVTAIAGNRGQANYAAAKAGLIGATRSLSRELASRGVTVNAVAPGIIQSPAADAAFPPDLVKALVPAGRSGTADEVAAVVAFLCSQQASYVSGQCISVDGGMI